MLTVVLCRENQFKIATDLKITDDLCVKYFINDIYVGKTVSSPHELSFERELDVSEDLSVYYQIWNDKTMLVESLPSNVEVQRVTFHKSRAVQTKTTSIGKKYAIIFGISDYKNIGDLSYCDEDATDWYNYFFSKGYQIQLFGDKHEKHYPSYNGLATEQNVRKAIRNILKVATANDTVAIISSGHGSSTDKVGSSYLCMYDCKHGKNDGKYTDKELLSDLSYAINKPKIFIFIDNCYSGGMLDELRSLNNITALSTCTENGYGYDDAEHNNGAWTYCFLECGLIRQFGGQAPINKVFEWAKANYAKISGNAGPGDQPQAVLNLGPDFQL